MMQLRMKMARNIQRIVLANVTEVQEKVRDGRGKRRKPAVG